MLRHTFCTTLAARGVAVELIRDLVGHADVRTTLRYMHITDEGREAAITSAFDTRPHVLAVS